MLEKSLEDIEYEATVAFAGGRVKELENIDKLNISIDSAYNTIKTIYTSIPIDSIFGIDIDTLLEDLKCTVMLYSCCYAMDYIIKKEETSDNELNSTFIRHYYDCDSTISPHIMNNIKSNIKKVSDVSSYPDPGRVNPYIGKQYEKNTKGHSHIYSGNILTFLKRNILIKGKKKYIKSSCPSVIFVALKVLGYLPNGGNTNKSKEEIQLTTIKMIDAAVNGGAIFANKEQKRPYIAVQKKLLYKGINEENSELINSVVFDDLFKIERIDTALKRYDTYIKKERKRALTRKNECFAAYICSLFMEIPFPLLSKVQGFFEEFLMRAIDGGNKESYDNYIKEILLFISFIFPTTVGLFCTMIFDISFEDPMIRRNIDKVFRIIENDSGKNIYLKEREYIWSDNSTFYSNKTKSENYTHYYWTDNRHKISVSKALGIMMNETYDTVRIKKIGEENRSRYEEIFLNLKYYSEHGKLIKEYLDKKPITPMQYAEALTKDFLITAEKMNKLK